MNLYFRYLLLFWLCFGAILVPKTHQAQGSSNLVGVVFVDGNSDCSYTSVVEPAISGVIVEALSLSSGERYFGTTDINGAYLITVPSASPVFPEVYRIGAYLPEGNTYWQFCAPVPFGNYLDTLQVDSITSVYTRNLAASPRVFCNLIEPNLLQNNLTPCDTVSLLVKYSNRGGIYFNPMLEVQLDEALTYIGSSNVSAQVMPLGNNKYQFLISDTLNYFETRAFTIQVLVSCNATVGQVHCSSVESVGDSLCLNTIWQSPILEVTDSCTSNGIQFKVLNKGNAMPAPQGYFVIRDDIMLRQATIPALGTGQFFTTFETNTNFNQTYRFQTEQDSLIPDIVGDNVKWATSSSCQQGDARNAFTNWFYTGDRSLVRDVSCMSNPTPYVPNQKIANPLGYGAEHYIPNDAAPIEYSFNFQNTGTSFANNVYIIDTLSPHLDPATIQMGASTHPYQWQVRDNGVLAIAFSNIGLTTSALDPQLSQGSVSFKIKQKQGLAWGTRIENKSNIYFDSQLTVNTNQVFHTIGGTTGSIVQSSQRVTNAQTSPAIRVYPNPFVEQTTFETPNQTYQELTLEIFNATGSTIQVIQTFQNKTVQFLRQNLPQGLYFYRLMGDGQLLDSGKIIAQ